MCGGIVSSTNDDSVTCLVHGGGGRAIRQVTHYQMELTPLDIREDVSVDHAYFQTSLPSTPHMDVLVVRFSGVSGFGCANNDDATYMDAMIRAGIVSWDPSAVLLDLREMAYEWGDMMVNPLCAGHGYFVDGSLPIAVVVSGLNRDGLTSLVADEMQSEPATLLFETMDAALAHLDSAYKNLTSGS